jgi:hypothetical protein
MNEVPPSGAVPAQSSPSASPQLAEVVGGEVAQVPMVLPAAIVQVPVQHWALAEQTSPPCVQNEEGWQVPLLAHRPEQHCALLEHVFPRDMQFTPGVIAAQLPPVHV